MHELSSCVSESQAVPQLKHCLPVQVLVWRDLRLYYHELAAALKMHHSLIWIRVNVKLLFPKDISNEKSTSRLEGSLAQTSWQCATIFLGLSPNLTVCAFTYWPLHLQCFLLKLVKGWKWLCNAWWSERGMQDSWCWSDDRQRAMLVRC